MVAILCSLKISLSKISHLSTSLLPAFYLTLESLLSYWLPPWLSHELFLFQHSCDHLKTMRYFCIVYWSVCEFSYLWMNWYIIFFMMSSTPLPLISSSQQLPKVYQQHDFPSHHSDYSDSESLPYDNFILIFNNITKQIDK